MRSEHVESMLSVLWIRIKISDDFSSIIYKSDFKCDHGTVHVIVLQTIISEQIKHVLYTSLVTDRFMKVINISELFVIVDFWLEVYNVIILKINVDL